MNLSQLQQNRIPFLGAILGAFLPFLSSAEQGSGYPTLFCHGLHGGPVQAAKYIPKHTALTGETINSPHATEFLSEPLCAPVFPEVSLRNTKTDSRRKTAVCKILGAFDKKMFGYQIEPLATPGLTLAGRGLCIFKNSFAQQPDLDVLASAYKKHHQENPNHKMLLWGCSRGAAAACTFACTHAAEVAQQVQLVVLEGCFDSSVSVIEKRFKRFGKRGIAQIKKFFEKNTQWRENGISPLAVLDKWPDNVPVLFVTSRKDTVVPMECTINCAKKLKELKPNTDVYLLILNKSSHSGYVFDDPADRALYDVVVHAFYQKYGWKHDPAKAALGAAKLERIKL